MPGQDRTRHDRLRALLPRAYATDPADSVLGVLIEVLGNLLRDTDRDIERALRDRWLATAAGDRSANAPEGGDVLGRLSALPTIDLAGLMPLELLGAALDLVRQPWEVDHEAYRNRVRLLGPMIARGLGTPRVVLSFALTSLHSEPCPVLEHSGDDTRAVGLPPRSLSRCRTCRGGRVQPPPDTACPLRHHAIMHATVSDNPLTLMELRRRRMEPARGDDGGARIRVHSDNLFSARPDIVLQVPADTAPGTTMIVALRSEETGEEVVVVHPLAAGDTLTIRPASEHVPGTPRHRQYWVDRPQGGALSESRAFRARAGEVLDLAGRVVTLTHDPSAGVMGRQATPGTVERRVSSPELPPGASTWTLRSLGRAEVAEILARASAPDLEPVLDEVPAAPWAVPVDLALRWWTRPPARFRLQIARNDHVMAALEAGADHYLIRMIDRVRAAGVQPILDFVEPAITDAIDPRDALLAVEPRMREPVAPGDRFMGMALALAAEPLEPRDHMCFLGSFDTMFFDMSCLLATSVAPAQLDVTTLEHSLAQTLGAELLTFDHSFFDWGTVSALTPATAVLETSYFETALLAV